jgi:hypothetical protein
LKPNHTVLRQKATSATMSDDTDDVGTTSKCHNLWVPHVSTNLLPLSARPIKKIKMPSK